MFKAVITTVVMALSEKQKNCSSDKTTTVCGDSSESLQLPTKPHSRACESTYNNVLFTPPAMCRLTVIRAETIQYPVRFVRPILRAADCNIIEIPAFQHKDFTVCH